MIEWTAVRSSNVGRVGYDEDADELLIEFLSGAVYAYPNQGRSAFEDLVSNPSPGQYVARWLRSAPSRRVS